MLSKYFLQSQEEAEGVPVALSNWPLLAPPLTTSDACKRLAIFTPGAYSFVAISIIFYSNQSSVIVLDWQLCIREHSNLSSSNSCSALCPKVRVAKELRQSSLDEDLLSMWGVPQANQICIKTIACFSLTQTSHKTFMSSWKKFAENN